MYSFLSAKNRIFALANPMQMYEMFVKNKQSAGTKIQNIPFL